MSLDLVQLRTDLRKSLGGLDTTDLSNTEADLLLNKSFWEIMDKFPFREKQSTLTFDYTDGVRLYTAPSPFEAVLKISISDPTDGADNKHKPLDRMTIDWYEQQYDPDDDQEGKPEFYMRYEDGFYVYPTPDKTYNGVIWYNTTLADLSVANDVPVIPQVWHEIIGFGASWRGWSDLGNLERVTFYRNLQVSLIESTSPVEAKEEEDSPRAGVELPDEMTRI